MSTSRFGSLALALMLTRVGAASPQTPESPQPQPGGRLVVAAQPWAKVTIDGKPYGNTPLEDIALAPGAHRLVLAHPRFGELEREVTIASGETTRVFVDLQKREASAAKTSAEEKAGKAENKPARPSSAAQLANVRIDLTLTDRIPGQPAVAKTTTMTVADDESGMLRASSEIGPAVGPKRFYQLNIDTRPRIVDGNRIRLRLTVEYQPQGTADTTLPNLSLRQSGATLLESGRPVVIAEGTDPVTDRRITLEVKATILR